MTPHDAKASPSETMSTNNSSKRASSEAPPGVEMCQFPAMIYTYTINHANGASNFPYVSEYCETLFGYTADNLVEHPELLMNSVHEADSEKFTKVSEVDSCARPVYCNTVLTPNLPLDLLTIL
jgi:hypothetical protein